MKTKNDNTAESEVLAKTLTTLEGFDAESQKRILLTAAILLGITLTTFDEN